MANNYYPPTTPYGTSGEFPGRVLGIVALILSLVNLIGVPSALIGAILGHVAYAQSKKAGFKNTPALVAIIAGWAIVALTILFFGFFLTLALVASGA